MARARTRVSSAYPCWQNVSAAGAPVVVRASGPFASDLSDVVRSHEDYDRLTQVDARRHRCVDVAVHPVLIKPRSKACLTQHVVHTANTAVILPVQAVHAPVVREEPVEATLKSGVGRPRQRRLPDRRRHASDRSVVGMHERWRDGDLSDTVLQVYYLKRPVAFGTG